MEFAERKTIKALLARKIPAYNQIRRDLLETSSQCPTSCRRGIALCCSGEVQLTSGDRLVMILHTLKRMVSFLIQALLDLVPAFAEI